MACDMVKFGMEIMFTSGMENALEFTAKVQEGDNYVEHKNDTYYDDPRDNTAFERCIDVMSRLILKYGPDMLEKLNQKQMTDTHCKETDHML